MGQDKHHDDKLIVLSVVAAVVITKLGDGFINIFLNDPLLLKIENASIRGIVILLIWIVVLVGLTVGLLPIIKWIINKSFEKEKDE